MKTGLQFLLLSHDLFFPWLSRESQAFFCKRIPSLCLVNFVSFATFFYFFLEKKEVIYGVYNSEERGKKTRYLFSCQSFIAHPWGSKNREKTVLLSVLQIYLILRQMVHFHQEMMSADEEKELESQAACKSKNNTHRTLLSIESDQRSWGERDDGDLEGIFFLPIIIFFPSFPSSSSFSSLPSSSTWCCLSILILILGQIQTE